ncbi:MAG: sugar transferase [Deltaproteobacteria bacterium]|nr:sugar transferase [Deltaproteobacteria bacterium]
MTAARPGGGGCRRDSSGDEARRRILDVAASLTGIALLSPLLLVVAALVKFQDGGPAFYRGVRVGRGGRLFRIYKFRTMVPNAHLLGPGLTTRRDPRVTPLGRWLRRTKLDELPQLFNVLLGDMSLVGARPEDPRYVAVYTDRQREILRHRPGITSPASLSFRREEELLTGPGWEQRYLEEVLPAKLEMDRAYLERRTVPDDLCLIARTLRALLA